MSQSSGMSAAPDGRVTGGGPAALAAGRQRPGGRADARRNRARLLAAARAEFGEHGEAMQIERVATRAGVGVGTVYRNFPTKDDLIAAVVFDSIHELRVAAEQIDPAADPWEALRAHLLLKADRVFESQAYGHLVRAEVQRRPDIAEELERTYDALALVVWRAQDAGVLRTDLDHRELADLVVRIASTPVGLSLDREEARARMRRFVQVMLDGLHRPASANGEAARPARPAPDGTDR